jgi:hypothetical protein
VHWGMGFAAVAQGHFGIEADDLAAKIIRDAWA